jgi:hypothetical protein
MESRCTHAHLYPPDWNVTAGIFTSAFGKDISKYPTERPFPLMIFHFLPK